MWRYISDAANRFVTSVWNSLTFVFNLIPAPFVLLSINYKLLTFKNIFAFARAGFGSYSNLKMLANAVLVEKNPEAAAATATSEPERSSQWDDSRHHSRDKTVVADHDEQRHQRDRAQKIKAEMFEMATHDLDKTKFVKDDFASIVRAMGILKATEFFASVDADDKIASSEAFLQFYEDHRESSEQVARVYAACEKFAKSLSIPSVEIRSLFIEVWDSVTRRVPYSRSDNTMKLKDLKPVVDLVVASENGLIEHISKDTLLPILLRHADLEIKHCQIDLARATTTSSKDVKAYQDRLDSAEQVLAGLVGFPQAPIGMHRRMAPPAFHFGAAGRQPFSSAYAPAGMSEDSRGVDAPPFGAGSVLRQDQQRGGYDRSPPSPLATAAMGGQQQYPTTTVTGADDGEARSAAFVPRVGGSYDGHPHAGSTASDMYQYGGGGGRAWEEDDASLPPPPFGGGVGRTVSTMRQHGRAGAFDSVAAPFGEHTDDVTTRATRFGAGSGNGSK